MIDDINKIKEDILEYIEIRLDLIRLHTAENISRMLSSVINLAVVGYLLFFILLFLSIAAGFFLGSVFESNELGFLCVAGAYFLFLLTFLVFRAKIVEKPVIKAIMKLFFPKFGDDEKVR